MKFWILEWGVFDRALFDNREGVSNDSLTIEHLAGESVS